MATAANPSAKGGPRWTERVGRFFRDVRAEFRKVVWPTRKELTVYTGVVIAMTLIVAVILGVVDFGLQALVSALSAIGG